MAHFCCSCAPTLIFTYLSISLPACLPVLSTSQPHPRPQNIPLEITSPDRQISPQNRLPGNIATQREDGNISGLVKDFFPVATAWIWVKKPSANCSPRFRRLDFLLQPLGAARISSKVPGATTSRNLAYYLSEARHHRA